MATTNDKHYSETITTEMEESAKARGTGIAKRSPLYIEQKMEEGKAIIALTTEGTWVGFCYIEVWEQSEYVANSGLIVSLAFRKTGVATEIKKKIFELSRKKYPESKIFGLTTGLAVMKINSDLGYEPVTYSELTNDEAFWKGCQSCINFDILTSKNRKNCLCTAMLFDPAEAAKKAIEAKPLPEVKKNEGFRDKVNVFDRLVRLKQYVWLKGWKKKDEEGNAKKNSILSLFFFW